MHTALTTAETAAVTHTSVRQVRAWCRSGQLRAVKSHGRWAVRVSAVARLLCPATDRLRRGVTARQSTGRTGRRTAARQLARATSRTYRIPLVGRHQRARIACANSGHVIARDYLFDLGLDVEFIDEFESAYGRKTAQVYRQRHHADPDTRGLVILHGRLWHVARYTDVTDLHAGACAYARTRGLFELVA